MYFQKNKTRKKQNKVKTPKSKNKKLCINFDRNVNEVQFIQSGSTWTKDK